MCLKTQNRGILDLLSADHFLNLWRAIKYFGKYVFSVFSTKNNLPLIIENIIFIFLQRTWFIITWRKCLKNKAIWKAKSNSILLLSQLTFEYGFLAYRPLKAMEGHGRPWKAMEGHERPIQTVFSAFMAFQICS